MLTTYKGLEPEIETFDWKVNEHPQGSTKVQQVQQVQQELI